ncbi:MULTISPECIES: NAD(P)/FAD-dependent oxidoreductase [Geobacillus]|uniref:Ferredoxin--NADP reductase n=1 Tax=Geobacillus thermocatenulatus TaxID=33938 RepID=A0A226Q6W4_9BACL|nr:MULTISPECIES: NAD(P)/FAD-dependent oxidoreductase [Geobacillus]KPD00048.1 Ferredoxin--NADP reductase [Geobacillus sp. BCO2]RAN30761.1 thioredoxin reductase [Geobacillus sp. A8]AST00768.1 thioredoxin reductase [Geobacillus thermocatenulatus]KLR72065.1 thioredoxin reductase [Geobacillus sp. T6]OXB87450.1 thioredoxin reductase [Geobacillus thermocatenulatus]
MADLYDVTIIGGGPAGLYASFYSGLRQMKTKLIEYQPQLGGKLHVYPEKFIWDVGGHAPITGEQLMNQLIKQALLFDPTIVLNEKVTAILRQPDGTFLLQTASGEQHWSKTVIVAVGSGIIKPKKLDIEGAETFEVTNLHYTVKSLQRFKGKTVIISGGGNSAIDWANELVPIAKTVYVTYRNEEFKGHEAPVSQLLHSGAVCYFHTSITKLIADARHHAIEQVELTNHATGEVVHLPVDEVIVSHGYEIDTSLLKNSHLHIKMVDDYYIAGNANSETSVPGLYAAGDILKYDGKLHLIAGAFQDAANAVNSAKRFIDPSAERFAMVSSHNERFQEKNQAIIEQLIKGV